MFIVGLTGGIGSGKSAAANIFETLNIEVVNADKVARQVVELGTPALEQIVSHFGAAILLADKSLNRAALRKIIFENQTEKNWLEALLHPEIRKLTRQKLQAATSPYAIYESPLLLEMGQDQNVDRVLVIDVPASLQIARATKRDKNSEDQIKAIIKTQISREERLYKADDIIDNSRGLENLKTEINRLHQQYLLLASEAEKNNE